MQDAMVSGQLIQADPDSPEEAQCPACGSTVTKRKRRRMGKGITFFYRHVQGQGGECLRRYTPISADR